jgi:fucose permease
VSDLTLKYRHFLVFAAACAGMLLFGVTLTTLGSVLPSLMPRHGLDRTSAGSLLSIMSMGILAASMVFGPIVDRRGYKGVLVAAALGVLVGLEGIAFAPTVSTLSAAVFLFGFSGGIINGSTNALVSDVSVRGRGSSLSLLGVFFGLGAFGVPLVLGILLRWLDYATVLALFGLAVLIPVAMFLAIQFPPPKQPQGFPIRQAGTLLRERMLLLLGLMLFFQSGMEITVGGWSAQFAHEALGLDESRSVLVLSLFWIGMMTARIILTPLLAHWPSGWVLGAFMAAAAIGSVLLLYCEGQQMAMAGLFLIGFGLAAGYPVVLGAIGEIYTKLCGTAFSIAFVIALAGGTAVPYLTGLLADQLGLRQSLLTVPIAGLFMFSLLLGVVSSGMPEAQVFTRRKEEAHARA